VPDTAAQLHRPEALAQRKSDGERVDHAGRRNVKEKSGFEEGMRVVIFDDTGAYDIFTITHVQTSSLHLQHRPPNPDFSKKYTPDENARIAQVDTHVYYLDGGAAQLHHYDGFLEDIPIVDNSIGARFRYFGDPNPPLLPRPQAGSSNCIIDTAGNTRLPVLPSGGSSLVELTQDMLTDGPVCGVAPNHFDADLFRIRKVSVQLRMQVGRPEMRGANPAGETLFQNPGTSNNAYRRVPDYVVQFDVAPRNMNLVR
jgi:hypothetical protein